MRTRDKAKTSGWRGRNVSLLLALGWALAAALPVLAQAAALQLTVHKTLGFDNGSQIQGSFRLDASGPANLASVTFTLDGQTLAQVGALPFAFDLNTGQFAPGWHTVGASGRTADGQTLTAADRRYEFLSAAQAQAATRKIIVPILAVVGVALLVGLGSQLFVAVRGGRSRSALPLGAARNYGFLGGAICSKCGRPFSIHWWGLNAGIGQKFDRCDHCGKWSLVRAAPREKLAAAEAAEIQQAQPATPIAGMSAEEKLKRELDASRFEEH